MKTAKTIQEPVCIVVSTYPCPSCKTTHRMSQKWSMGSMIDKKALGFDPGRCIIDFAFGGMKRQLSERCGVDMDANLVTIDIGGCDIPE